MITHFSSTANPVRTASGQDPVTAPTRSVAVVVAAVDVGEEPARSRAVLEVAAGLTAGTRRRAVLHVVHGWSLVGASILSCPTRGLSRESMRSLVTRVGGVYRDRVVSLCDEVLPSRPDGFFVRRGDPRTVIPEAARRLRADIVVMGGGSGSGLARLVLGSVARAVVDRVSCDVLVVRDRYPW